jgi:uncharacterized protein
MWVRVQRGLSLRRPADGRMSRYPHPPADPPRFLADVMLERLARWLRVLGYDTTSAGADEDDAALARRAADEERWLLTRDRRLAEETPRALGVLLRAGPPLAQLREVGDRLALAPAERALFTRCLLCNTPLRAATDAEAAAALPDLCDAHRPEPVRACPGCGRVYWDGSHTRRMRAALARALGPAAGG